MSTKVNDMKIFRAQSHTLTHTHNEQKRKILRLNFPGMMKNQWEKFKVERTLKEGSGCEN